MGPPSPPRRSFLPLPQAQKGARGQTQYTVLFLSRDGLLDPRTSSARALPSSRPLPQPRLRQAGFSQLPPIGQELRRFRQ